MGQVTFSGSGLTFEGGTRTFGGFSVPKNFIPIKFTYQMTPASSSLSVSRLNKSNGVQIASGNSGSGDLTQDTQNDAFGAGHYLQAQISSGSSGVSISYTLTYIGHPVAAGMIHT